MKITVDLVFQTYVNFAERVTIERNEKSSLPDSKVDRIRQAKTKSQSVFLRAQHKVTPPREDSPQWARSGEGDSR